MPKQAREVVLGVTGSVAIYKACDIARGLRRLGYTVTPVMTREAREFISPLLLQTISANRVLSDMFETPTEWDPLHISVADRASAVLIAPATAQIIGKIAAGICDDLLSCIVVSTKAPVLFAPAMNGRMYRHPAVQNNISSLQRMGYRFVGPVKGELACGDVDIGHLAPVEDIVSETAKLIKANARR